MSLQGLVLLAVDTAQEEAECLNAVADWFLQATFDMVHVVHVPVQFEETMRRAGSDQARITGYRDDLVRKAQSTLNTIGEGLNNRSTPVSVQVLTGDPSSVLLRLSENPNTELIVLEPGSSSQIHQALLGSVTRRVLRAALCDVLVLRT